MEYISYTQKHENLDSCLGSRSRFEILYEIEIDIIVALDDNNENTLINSFEYHNLAILKQFTSEAGPCDILTENYLVNRINHFMEETGSDNVLDWMFSSVIYNKSLISLVKKEVLKLVF